MTGFVLIADFETVRSMSNRFHGKQAQLDSGDLFMALAIVAALIVAAVILTRLTRRQDRQTHYSSPRGLFNELCRAHELDHSDRRLIRRLAASQGLDQPSRLFLEADRWNVRDLPSNLQSQADRYQALFERLFSMETETVSEATTELSVAAANSVPLAPPTDVGNAAPLAIPLPDLAPMPGFGSDQPVLGG